MRVFETLSHTKGGQVGRTDRERSVRREVDESDGAIENTRWTAC